MGNAMITACPCISPPEQSPSPTTKLISLGGATTILTRKTLAGEIISQFPNQIVCYSDSFFLGQPIPSLAVDDELIEGQTYFLFPADFFPQGRFSVSSLAALVSGHPNGKNGVPISFKDCPLEYVKGSSGTVLIRIAPEFITRLITRENNINGSGHKKIVEEKVDSFLCNTPLLKKHYDQLVGCNKDRVWSPKLETISEGKIRFSAFRLLEFQWRRRKKTMKS